MILIVDFSNMIIPKFTFCSSTAHTNSSEGVGGRRDLQTIDTNSRATRDLASTRLWYIFPSSFCCPLQS